LTREMNLKGGKKNWVLQMVDAGGLTARGRQGRPITPAEEYPNSEVSESRHIGCAPTKRDSSLQELVTEPRRCTNDL